MSATRLRSSQPPRVSRHPQDDPLLPPHLSSPGQSSVVSLVEQEIVEAGTSGEHRSDRQLLLSVRSFTLLCFSSLTWTHSLSRLLLESTSDKTRPTALILQRDRLEEGPGLVGPRSRHVRPDIEPAEIRLPSKGARWNEHSDLTSFARHHGLCSVRVEFGVPLGAPVKTENKSAMGSRCAARE